MKPIFQKILDVDKGDCASACLASILEIELEQVPSFWELARGSTPRMQDEMRSWLESLGYCLLTVPVKDTFILYSNLVGCHAFAGVKSQMFEGVHHGVVVTWVQKDEHTVGMEIVHDPNPQNKRKYKPSEIEDLSFLIPINPRVLR